MWKEFFRFDLRYQLRQPLLWIVTLPLVVIGFLTASSETFRLGGSIGNVHMNAPTVVANQLGIMSIIAMFLVVVFVAGSVLRDAEAGISDLLFATPMRKIDYLSGRFLAGLLVCLLIFALITLAMMIGSSLPSIDPNRVGPFTIATYVWVFVVFVVPNLLFIATFLMLLAAVTRSMILVYVGVLAFIVLWSVAGLLRGTVGSEALAAMLDPFGVRALWFVTRYYSSFELNTRLPELSGQLLANRILWTVLAVAAFAATVVLFKPQRIGTGRRWFGRTVASTQAITKAPAAPTIAVAALRCAPQFSAITGWVQFWHVLRFDMKGVLKSLPFLVMLLLALANFIANYTIGGMRFDSQPYPLTHLMLDDLASGINDVLVIILIFFSGELIFKERQANIADLTDAMPVPNWVPLLAKCGALISVIWTFLFAGVAVAIVIQLIKGGAPIEIWLYVQGTLIASAYFILMAIAVLTLQVLANNKFAGYALAIALFASNVILQGLGYNHRLINFASLPPLVYSDLNGYGHFLAGWSWFVIYWSLFAMALWIVAQAFWVRGVSHGWRARWSGARRNLSFGTLTLTLLAFAATGGWIFYNTNVLNHYMSTNAALDDMATYETLYGRYLNLPHPSITSLRTDVDIYPEQRKVYIHGHYILTNKTASALDTLRIQNFPGVETHWLDLPLHTVVLDDRHFGFSILRLMTPLVPGASIPLDFTVNVRNEGFTNGAAPDGVNYNGTLFTFENFFPRFGYNQSVEIADRNERRKRGLGEPRGMPKLEDKQAQRNNYWKLWGFEADFMDFETTISTSSDQVALAPGDLISSWEKDGRRYFHYKLDQPALPFFSFQSGRWDMKKTDWNGVAIEVYYDHKHPYNIDRMVDGSKRGLDYMISNFGPYQHKQLRIVEVPLYQAYARSFPNTIPFSESLGFINDLRNPNDVDHVFYVTAHELAHQWWGDQAVAANVQGSGMVTETLAEYSALMVTEKEFGAEKVRHILRFDLDEYLTGRSRELNVEQPLVRNEGQVYLQYRKGSMVMYRLRQEIGEAAVNRALGRFISDNRYKSDPYPTSADVVRYLRAEAPADKQGLITDLFERIVLYDNRMIDATAVQRKDGQWDVTMKIKLAKMEADGKGKESARAYDEPVDIAIFARSHGAAERDERILLSEKRVLPAGQSSITVTVKEKPYEAGVDPYHLLIERNPADNRKLITSG